MQLKIILNIILIRSIWFIDGTLTGTITRGEIEPGNIDNKAWLYTLRTGVSLPNIISCDTQKTLISDNS